MATSKVLNTANWLLPGILTYKVLLYINPHITCLLGDHPCMLSLFGTWHSPTVREASILTKAFSLDRQLGFIPLLGSISLQTRFPPVSCF